MKSAEWFGHYLQNHFLVHKTHAWHPVRDQYDWVRDETAIFARQLRNQGYPVTGDTIRLVEMLFHTLWSTQLDYWAGRASCSECSP